MSQLNTPVPFLDLTEEFSDLAAEWFDDLNRIGASGQFILGEHVTRFEQEFASHVGVEHAIAVANGTDALLLSLRVLDIGPDDEVITTPFTFFATAEVISAVGARPVFVDIEPGTFNINADLIAAAVTPRTRAIIPVHLFGGPADMTAIGAVADAHGLAIVEDCAQAFGATHGDSQVGTFGKTGCFSFYPTKILGCYGDGGMISTRDSDIAAGLRRLRNHGATAPFIHAEIGMNSRLDEVQASLLRIKLRQVDRAIAGRRRAAGEYDSRLRGSAVAVPVRPVSGDHVFNLYTVRVRDRDAVRQRLNTAGIGNSVCYPVPLHLQEVYRNLGYRPGSLPVSEAAARECLSLPIFPGLSDEQISRVCKVLLEK